MNIFKKILIPVLLFSSIFTIAGCGKKKDKKKTNEIITHEAAKGKIGKDGGQLSDKDNNVSLNIPKDALDKDTEISMKYVSCDEEISDSPSLSFLGAVEYGPSGTKFNKEVEAKVKLTKAPTNSTISVYCYDEENDIWDYVTSATVSNGYATCKITHFSKYEYLDITPTMHNKYETLVRQAISEGKSDEWITLTYYDYLVDECHVLDYYPNYDGYYYYGCGLKINGNYQVGEKKGNAEELSYIWGDSNKVGNTYGKSSVSGSTTSYEDYKKATEGESSNVDAITVTVIVEYKIITPQFTMSATKTELKKGESADVTVYCHYYDAANTLHQDFPLDDYYLTLNCSSSNFILDKTSVTTDASGKAKFKVTCNKDGEKAIIKAIFDVSGDFGTHAEGSIHFGSEGGYTISGHITETLSFIYHVDPTFVDGCSITSNGTFRLTIEYDIEGTLKDENGNIGGTINFTNIDATYSSSKNGLIIVEDGETSVGAYDIFGAKENSEKTGTPSYSVSISSKGIEVEDFETITTLYGSGISYGHTPAGDIDYSYPSVIAIKNKSSLLLPFTFEEGTSTNSSTSLKDNIEILFDFEGYTTALENWTGIIVESKTESTTQTITITSGSGN